MNDFPLYPELPEGGAEAAQALVNRFKDDLIKTASEAIGALYCDVVPHIESDSWTNYRNDMLDGFCDYTKNKVAAPHDFKRIRQAILKEHRAEIIADLNQDLLDEVAKLKHHIEFLQGLRG